jgi:beta-glucanase (GH16 family)
MQFFRVPKKVCYVCAGVLMALAVSTFSASSQTWVLQQGLSDEFNYPAGTSIDLDKWAFRPTNLYSSSETARFTDWQYNVPPDSHMTDYNLRTTDSSIQIVARNLPPSQYKQSSAGLNSKCKMAFTYGRIECRVRPPSTTVSGLWPSVWMMGSNSGILPGCTAPAAVKWPDCGEIDVWEYVSRTPDTYLANGYCNTACANTVSSTISTGTQAGVWRIYCCRWDSNQVTYWYRNDSDPSDATRGLVTKSLAGCSCFSADMYFNIDMLIGQTFGGPVNCAFPETLEVDYIRTYKPATGQTSVKETSPASGSSHPAPAGVKFLAGKSVLHVLTEDASRLQISIFDARGRLVTVVTNGYLPAGAHDFPWNPDRAGPGVFIATVKSGASVMSCKVARCPASSKRYLPNLK